MISIGKSNYHQTLSHHQHEVGSSRHTGLNSALVVVLVFLSYWLPGCLASQLYNMPCVFHGPRGCRFLVAQNEATQVKQHESHNAHINMNDSRSSNSSRSRKRSIKNTK